MMAATEPLAIYIHWPFCASKCPYCDFNAHVRDHIDQAEWAKAYQQELHNYARQTQGRIITSIFFGGGTPSLMPPETVHAILQTIRDLWTVAPSCEITMEANPTTSEATKFQAFRDNGINRVSIGVQALNDPDLKALGRNHSTSEALKAIEAARSVFDRTSFDLIYARQGQTAKDWSNELSRALDLCDGHLSLYQLTIEAGTEFHTLYKTGRLILPDEEASLHMYDITQELCQQAGLPAYELSNHARPGQESQHNMTYWLGGDYLGIGPGAHGRITISDDRIATVGHHAPEIWLQLIKQQGTGTNRENRLTPAQQTGERLMLGLRIDRGVEVSPLAPFMDEAFLARAVDEGLLIHDANRLRATKKGRLLLNGIVAGLLKD